MTGPANEGSNYWTRATQRVSRRSVIRGGVGASIATGLFLVGCSSSDDASPTATGTATTSPSGTATAAAPTGTVTVAVSGLGNQNYDPAKASGLGEEFANAHFGEALVIMGPEKNTYVGGIAESWETTTDDGLTWAFTIREGVTAHDGSTITTDDVAYTVERWIDPANEPVSGATMQKILDHLEVTDRQVIFHLKEPYPFIVHLAYMQITPRAAVEAAGANFGKQPISAGPFRFVSARPDQGVTLEAFEGHYRKVPGFKTLELLHIPEVTTRLASLQAGESDVMLKPSGPALLELESGANGITMHESESTSANAIYFLDLGREESFADSVWQDVRLRQAVAHSVDIQQLIDRIYFGRGVAVGVPAAVPGLPGVPDLAPRTFDPAEAQKLIAAAGAEGLEFPIYTYQSGAQAGSDDVAQALATYLNAVGFKTQATLVEYATFFENIRGGAWAGEGALSLQVVGARASESFLGVVDPNGSPSYRSEELAAEAKALYTVTGDKLLQGTTALAQKYYDLVVNVPLVSANYVQGYGPRIGSWEPRMRAGYELGMEYIELA